MSAPSRRPEIRRRRVRKVKISKLRSRYAKAGSDADRQKFFDKAKVLAPQLTREEFTKPLEPKA
jgi:hypothetical protein